MVPLTKINEEIKSPQTKEKPVKRKRVDNEKDLRRQVEKLRVEVSKSKKEKAMMEEMVVGGDNKRAFLDEQIQSKDERIAKLESNLVEEESVRLRIEEELTETNLKLTRSCSELGVLQTEHNECQGNIEFYQEKFAEVQCELMDRIGKYEELYSKYVMSESRSTKSEEQEAIEAESVVKDNEIRTLKIKLSKEREKVKYLEEKLAKSTRIKSTPTTFH